MPEKPPAKFVGLREVAQLTGVSLDTLRHGAAAAEAAGLLFRVGSGWVCESALAATVATVARGSRAAQTRAARKAGAK